jgi:senataxin
MTIPPSIQYRMHPDISQLPSQLFYGGRLRDGPDMAAKTRQVWHSDERFGAYTFYSVKHGREESAHVGHSLVNKAECQVIIALFDRLRRQYTTFDFDNKVGIVSMYKAQVKELKKVFQLRYGPTILEVVDFNTVDGFQGQEKDIIILSCVRAGTTLSTVGFLAGMNVLASKAYSSLTLW